VNYDVTQPLPYNSQGTDLALTGPESVSTWASQDIRIRLSTFLGQYRFDQSAGVDWLRLLDKGITTLEVREAIRVCVTACPAVVRVDSIESSYEPIARALSVKWFAVLSDGSELQGSELI
jgi:hypothetical protein